MKIRTVLSLVTLMFFVFPFILPAMNSYYQPRVLKWETGFSKHKNTDPEKWFSATVPGAVQTDYARANNWEPFYYAENWKDYLWMEDVYWTYRNQFEKPELEVGEQLFFYIAWN